MTGLNREYYLRLRKEYEPKNIKLVIVAESPPASGKYFYDTTGSPREPLFAALMLQLGLSPITKDAGLRELQQRGWILVDATYTSPSINSPRMQATIVTRLSPGIIPCS